MPERRDGRLFKERYVIEACSDGGGVAVDLATGGYFGLNASALLICRALESAPSIGDAVREVGTKLNLPATEAGQLVSQVADELSREVMRQASPEPLRYIANLDGTGIFAENESTIFSIDPTRRSVKLHASNEDLKAPLYFYVRSLMPKLLALLDVPVMHAAACRVGDRFLAFSGKSGAGKTTTARAFAQAGAELVSEDLLALAFKDGGTSIFLGSEKFARAWAEKAALRLKEGPNREISYIDLEGARQGVTAPIAELWLIESRKRTGINIQLRSLGATEAISAMLGSGFLASIDPERWRQFVQRSRLIAEGTAICEATMPRGLDELVGATRRYIVNSAS